MVKNNKNPVQTTAGSSSTKYRRRQLAFHGKTLQIIQLRENTNQQHYWSLNMLSIPVVKFLSLQVRLISQLLVYRTGQPLQVATWGSAECCSFHMPKIQKCKIFIIENLLNFFVQIWAGNNQFGRQLKPDVNNNKCMLLLSRKERCLETQEQKMNNQRFCDCMFS